MKLFGKNKRGIQLAINFLVTFILAIVIFGAGIFIVRTLVTDSEVTLNDLSGELESRLAALSCSAKDKVCLSNNEGRAERGEVFYYGVHVNNFLDVEANFTITVTNPRGYNTKDEEITAIDINPLPSYQTITIDPKSQGEKGFAMVVPKDAESGQYFYRIKVNSSNAAYSRVSETLIFTVR